MEWPGRITPGSKFCRCERPSAERRSCGPVFLCPEQSGGSQMRLPTRHSADAALRSFAYVLSLRARLVSCVARSGSVAS